MAMVYEAAAGTATAELRIPVKHTEDFLTKPLHGCLVKRDANLNAFIDKRYITDHNEYESCKYLFYSYPVEEFEGIVTNAVITYRKISKDKTSMELKECPLKNKPLVITFGGHFFLCCDFQDVKHSILPKKNPNASKFLQNYSTEFKIQNLGSEIYGLGFENKCLQFISLDLTRCQSEGSDIYRIRNDETRCTFVKLNEAGPLLLRKDGKTKFLVGCYKKCTDGTTGNCRIKVDMFGESHGDLTEPEERGAAALDSPPSNHPEENPIPSTPPPSHPEENPIPGTPPPGHPEENPIPGTPPPSHPEENPIPGTPPPSHPEENPIPDCPPHDHPEGNPIPDNIDGIPVGNEQQVYLQEFFEKDAENIKSLARFLDRRSLVVKNYEDLADLMKAPPFIKAKCKSNSAHSPTLDLLQMSKVSGLSVNDLIGKLRQISRKDVANEIENTIPENQRQCLTVKDAINDYWELLEKVAAMLDNKETVYNWKTFGGKLGFKRDELEQIELGCNPTERLLEDYVYPTLSAEKLTVERFKELMEKIERHDVLKLLRESGITEDDNPRSIKDVIPPQSELMWKVCLNLNVKNNTGKKNWQNLAFEWKIPHEIYSQFKPNQKSSPTELLLRWLISERPSFTANALCSLLEQIQRKDAKEFLEKKLRDSSEA